MRVTVLGKSYNVTVRGEGNGFRVYVPSRDIGWTTTLKPTESNVAMELARRLSYVPGR